uniref:Uncharacterized protein n=1 Tax=Moniliophthora roreri TaxID=221103 RepID=A0A0W0F4K9_MONRR
MLERFASSGTV